MQFQKGDICFCKEGLCEVKEGYTTNQEPPRYFYKVYSYARDSVYMLDESEMIKVTRVF